MLEEQECIMDRRVDRNKDPKLTVTEGGHDAPPETPNIEELSETEEPSEPYVPGPREGNPFETREEQPEKQPRYLDRWGKYAMGFTAATLVLAGGGLAVYALSPKDSPEEKAPSPKPSASASAFPSSKVEITPTTTSVTIETKTPPKETFPMTVEGIAEKLRIGPEVSAADMPKRLVADFNALLDSVDDYEGEVDKWNGATAIDPVKGKVYGTDALIATYRQGIQAAYGGDTFYSKFVAQKVADTAGQAGTWESDGLSDIQKEVVLLPTSVKDLGNYPDGKLVTFSMQVKTKGIDDPTVSPDVEAAFMVGTNIAGGIASFVSQTPPKIVELPR